MNDFPEAGRDQVRSHDYRHSDIGFSMAMIVVLILSIATSRLLAQAPPVSVQVAPGSRPGAVPNPTEPAKPGASTTPGENAASPAAQGDGTNADAKGANSDAEGKKDEAESPDSGTVKRPVQPPRVPDPREFDVKLNENERVKFNFHGQMWPDVLQWLASLGGHSLDWQELPNDYIHVASNRELTVVEARDLFNRLLFERGFTLVLQGNLLLVLKLDKLDPSLLRRVEDEAELMDLSPHEMVKITFTLPPELKADKAAEDVKPLLSRYAKVQPLMATNRLLIVDLVANLREVSRLGQCRACGGDRQDCAS